MLRTTAVSVLGEGTGISTSVPRVCTCVAFSILRMRTKAPRYMQLGTLSANPVSRAIQAHVLSSNPSDQPHALLNHHLFTDRWRLEHYNLISRTAIYTSFLHLLLLYFCAFWLPLMNIWTAKCLLWALSLVASIADHELMSWMERSQDLNALLLNSLSSHLNAPQTNIWFRFSYFTEKFVVQ